MGHLPIFITIVFISMYLNLAYQKLKFKYMMMTGPILIVQKPKQFFT